MSEQTPVPPAPDRHADGAFAVGRPQRPDGFVALHVRCAANRIEKAFAIDLRLEVDEWRLRVERPSGILHRVAETLLGQSPEPPPIELRIRLRHCYVRYHCRGVAIRADSKYRSAVEVGTYAETQASSDRSASTRDRSGRVDLTGSLTATSAAASVKGAFRVASGWHGTSSIERTIVASQDLYEVEAVPGGWRVGDRTHGDPLKRDGCLDGQYFARPVEGRPHSCDVEFLPGCTEGSIRFQVTARDGLVVETLRGEAATASDRDSAIDTMRNRLAAICIERSAGAGDAQEMILYGVKATCVVAKDAVPTEADRGDRRC